MCGIAGMYNLNGQPAQPTLVERMTFAMAHRGPDGQGVYSDGPVSLGQRRLAIIDLSSAGHQPMSDASGAVTITYNGEIYNYRELRKELEALGHRFRSRTDTEVIILAYLQWGEDCVRRFNGMFAFALWDGPGRRLFLARDRFGVKPLYYFHTPEVFLFASEVKALLEHPSVKAQVCYEALNEYFTFQNVLSDKTLFEGILMLPQGCTLTVRPGLAQPLRPARYWDYAFRRDGVPLSMEESAEEVYRLFDQAVTRQLVSDVPVGSYLSGGMDSGSITAVAARHIPRIHTFTGGFDLSSAMGLELEFDERAASEHMSHTFKTEHYETVIHAGDMEHILPKLIWHLEDLRVGQCYPNYYVARLASKFVKVVLSGGGGDELFGGYPWRYYQALKARTPQEYYQAYFGYWQRLVSDKDKALFFSPESYARARHCHPYDSFRGVYGDGDLPLETAEDLVNASLFFEIKTFLHGLLVVEDKLSMAHSLETRVPFLDNDLVDFAMRVPASYKLLGLGRGHLLEESLPGREGQVQPTRDGKVVLRQAMERLIPAEITQRVKQGFSAPDATWFRGESMEYIRRLLGDPKARIYEHVQPAYVATMLGQHAAGQVNHRLLIWSLLSFEWWLRLFVK
ncbi:MAG: asparagine synthase (glutamine-hydrolyzing) [Chloroflexi bacterium]|nr:asparagine synthase (glutamine-hydrolyzing) [Chloroflexota bacterium]